MQLAAATLTSFLLVATAFAAAPPPDGKRIGEAVESPRHTFRIQQYDVGVSAAEMLVTQTWLVSTTDPTVARRLPEVALANVEGGNNFGNDSGDTGYESSFAISADERFLFREQKICHGANAAYLYVHVGKLAYRARALAGLRLDLAVKQLFARQTGGKEEEEEMGIVELVAWTGGGRNLVVSLRGRDVSGFDVSGWQCTIDLQTGRVGVTEAQKRANAGTFTKTEPR